MSHAWYRPTFDGNQAAWLWFGKWRLDVGRATLGECQMRLISLSFWVTSVKKIQALRHEYVLLKHYNTFPRTLKKIEGPSVGPMTFSHRTWYSHCSDASVLVPSLRALTIRRRRQHLQQHSTQWFFWRPNFLFWYAYLWDSAAAC